MLIEFKVANFRCFRDEVTLSLQPGGRDRQLLGNIWQGNRYSALKSAAIFGSNASGKTSLLHALYVLSDFIEDSATKMNVGDPISGMEPFRLSTETTKEPSVFDVLVELDGTGYRYCLKATRKRVVREMLQRQDASKGAAWITLIDRDARQDKCILHERLGTEARRQQIAEDTRGNALVLSRAAERNVELVTPLFKWFSRCVNHMQAGLGTAPDEFHLESLAKKASEDSNLLSRLSDFVRDADTGIARVGVESDPLSTGGITVDGEDKLPPPAKEALSAVVDAINRLNDAMAEAKTKGKDGKRAEAFRFFTEHTDAEGEPVRFSLREESGGTRRYLRLVASLLNHFANGNLLAVDELHTSLHPQLARRVVQMAHSREFGSGGAQLLFTSHDATLLDPTLLRRDQIILTEKGADGAAQIFSLWDFEKMPRNTAAWERNYLAGRFGGVPILGPSIAEIPQENQPTIVRSTPGRE